MALHRAKSSRMTQPKFAHCALAAVLVAIPMSAGAQAPPSPPIEAPLPPILPWSGASERLVVAKTDPWITPAERADFVTTPNYAETRAWLDRLVAASPLLKIESFGRTAQGRELYFVRASKGGRGKPVCLSRQAFIPARSMARTLGSCFCATSHCAAKG